MASPPGTAPPASAHHGGEFERGRIGGTGVGADSAAHAAFPAKDWMTAFIERQGSLTDRARIGAEPACHSFEGETPLRVELHPRELVSGPNVRRHCQRRSWAGGSAGHGDAGRTGLVF